MAPDSDDEQYYEFGDAFDDPEGFYAPPKPPTFAEHRMRSGEILTLRLVGSHPLYGHLLWNAGRTVSEYLEERAGEWVEGKEILELGAGAGLPSLVCAVKGAKLAVVTDYPDPDLVENMRINAAACDKFVRQPSPLRVEGYAWGASTETICSHLQSPQSGFEVLILADVIYNHPQHHTLIASVQKTLKKTRDAVAFVVFTPYQPWLYDKIVAFFPLAEKSGFKVTKLFEKTMDKLLFEDDPGDEKMRRTVFGYELRWNEEHLPQS